MAEMQTVLDRLKVVIGDLVVENTMLHVELAELQADDKDDQDE